MFPKTIVKEIIRESLEYEPTSYTAQKIAQFIKDVVSGQTVILHFFGKVTGLGFDPEINTFFLCTFLGELNWSYENDWTRKMTRKFGTFTNFKACCGSMESIYLNPA